MICDNNITLHITDTNHLSIDWVTLLSRASKCSSNFSCTNKKQQKVLVWTVRFQFNFFLSTKKTQLFIESVVFEIHVATNYSAMTSADGPSHVF